MKDNGPRLIYEAGKLRYRPYSRLTVTDQRFSKKIAILPGIKYKNLPPSLPQNDL